MKYSSVCSGIEVAHLALSPNGFTPLWFSEIAKFPCKILKHYHSSVPNYGDMSNIADMILNKEIEAPQMLCGGTPCNSFSTLGKRQGMSDTRGTLTLHFAKIADAIDDVSDNKCLVLWENVEGILSEENNAFGVFLDRLTDNNHTLNVSKWANAGIVIGKKRTAVWRTLDAYHFAHAQHRRRVFVLATANPNYNVVNMILELSDKAIKTALTKKHYTSLITKLDNKHIEVFNDVASCLYASYAEKYNGNKTAYDGGLFVAVNGRIRRLTPVEFERLMGVPDNYTTVGNASDSVRYKAIGNAWARNVIEWLGERITQHYDTNVADFLKTPDTGIIQLHHTSKLANGKYLNASPSPNNSKHINILSVIDCDAEDRYYLTTTCCQGILRRATSKGIKMNTRLQALMRMQANQKPNSNDTILTTIGDNIKRLRKINHITQTELAKSTDISEKYINSIEKGQENMTVALLSRIANSLGVEVDILLRKN